MPFVIWSVCYLLYDGKTNSSVGAEFRASDKCDEYQPIRHVVSAEAVAWSTRIIPRYLLDRK